MTSEEHTHSASLASLPLSKIHLVDKRVQGQLGSRIVVLPAQVDICLSSRSNQRKYTLGVSATLACYEGCSTEMGYETVGGLLLLRRYMLFHCASWEKMPYYYMNLVEQSFCQAELEVRGQRRSRLWLRYYRFFWCS